MCTNPINIIFLTGFSLLCSSVTFSQPEYDKPKTFDFITHIPKDALQIAKSPFSKNALEPLLVVAGTTTILLFTDQSISNNIQDISEDAHFRSNENYKNVLSLRMRKKEISIIKAPLNLNTAIYQFGQGFPSLLIGAGLFTMGKIHNDYRALNTASQLAETFIIMGAGTQLLKRITGRQSPSDATRTGGAWHFLPSFKSFQQYTPKYDAFPSGHLATIVSTVTVLADNYPENRWIKPVGYSMTGLLGLAMINNKVHWTSDYPLAFALGYLCAKQVVKNNRRNSKETITKKENKEFNVSLSYFNRTFLPTVVYHF
ncbi:MAG: phosphatase PAP2 family protein [Flavitalea sp.]